MKLDNTIEKVKTLVEELDPEQIDFGGGDEPMDVGDVRQSVMELQEDAGTLYMEMETIDGNIYDQIQRAEVLASKMQELVDDRIEDVPDDEREHLLDSFDHVKAVILNLRMTKAPVGALLDKLDDVQVLTDQTLSSFEQAFGEQ